MVQVVQICCPKSWKRHEKCNFETPHCEMICALSIKEANVNAELGQHFQICLQSGPRGLTTPPKGQPGHKKAAFYRFPKFRWWGVQSCYRTPACKARTISKIFFICDPSSSMNRKTNQRFPKRKSSLTDSAFQRPSIIEIWMAPHNSCPKKPAKTTKWKTWWNNKLVKETKKIIWKTRRCASWKR